MTFCAYSHLQQAHNFFLHFQIVIRLNHVYLYLDISASCVLLNTRLLHLSPDKPIAAIHLALPT